MHSDSLGAFSTILLISVAFSAAVPVLVNSLAAYSAQMTHFRVICKAGRGRNSSISHSVKMTSRSDLDNLASHFTRK